MKHGLTKGKARSKRQYHPAYKAWQNMIQRCTNPNVRNYQNYGGRGIKVCDRWKSSLNFLEDMLGSWFEGATIDRIDNNGGYSPSNCQWVSKAANIAKTRRTYFVEYNGDRVTVRQLCALLGIESRYETVRRRIKAGIPLADALSNQRINYLLRS